MSADARVVIGKVVSPHGIRGQIKLSPLTDYPERFYEMNSLDLYREGTFVGSWKVRSVSELAQRGLLLVSLDGIDSMDAAETLRGCTIEIDKADRVPLPENEFWISDLVGLTALDEDGSPLGTVKDIVDSGAAQLIVVTDAGGRDHYIPAVPEFFRAADLSAGTITLHLIDGLWDL